MIRCLLCVCMMWEWKWTVLSILLCQGEMWNSQRYTGWKCWLTSIVTYRIVDCWLLSITTNFDCSRTAYVRYPLTLYTSSKKSDRTHRNQRVTTSRLVNWHGCFRADSLPHPPLPQKFLGEWRVDQWVRHFKLAYLGLYLNWPDVDI